MSRQFSSHQEFYPARSGGTIGGDRKAATGLVYQELGLTTAITGASGALILQQATALNTDQIIINAALIYVNALGGGLTYLEVGQYNISDPIDFPGNNLQLRGTGRGSFIDGDLLATNENAIEITGRDDCVIRDLSVQTNDGGDLLINCVEITDSDRFTVENITVINSDQHGIHITSDTAVIEGWITNCIVLDADVHGILVQGVAGTIILYIHIQGNTVSNVGGSGIFIVDSSRCICSSNIVREVGQNGIETNGSDNLDIIGNICVLNVRHGIFFDNCDDSDIVSNICVDNDSGDTGSFDGINIDNNSNDNIVQLNVCDDNDGFGINVVAATCNRNVVKNNKLRGNTTGAFNDAGTDTATHEIKILAPNQDSYVGAAPSNHRGQQCLDNVPTQVPFEIPIPNEFQELVTAHVIYVTGADGIINRSVATDFGKVCAGEQIDAHSDAIAAADIAGNTTDEFECDDVSAALDGLALGDWIGMTWTNFGAAAGTIDATVWVIGIRIRYV